MQANGLPTYSELEAEVERLRTIISGGIDVASAHGAEIQALRKRIDAQEVTIAQQAAHMATDADTIKRLENDATACRAEIEVDNMLHNAHREIQQYRDAEIAQLRATIAERDAEIAHMVKHIPEPAPVYAIDRYMDNSDPHAEYEASAEGNADIYLIRKWLDGAK